MRFPFIPSITTDIDSAHGWVETTYKSAPPRQFLFDNRFFLGPGSELVGLLLAP